MPGDRSDDPSLDTDDIPGAGLENTRVDSPDDGTFTVIVKDASGTVYNSANEVYVNIYSEGVPVWSGSKTIGGEDEDMDFAAVSFPDGIVTPEQACLGDARARAGEVQHREISLPSMCPKEAPFALSPLSDPHDDAQPHREPGMQ